MARGYYGSLIVAVAFLACVPLTAQEYNFRYLGAAQGLTNLAVRQIYQDRTGFLWVSTENGIFRYDGDRFERFGPPEGIPEASGASFGDAPDGSLLVGGNFGLYLLRPDNHFERVAAVEGAVNWAQGIQSASDDRTLIGTDRGLVELTSGPDRSIRSRLLPPPKGASGVRVDAVFVEGDTVWYGCGLGICRMDKDGTTVLGVERGLPESGWLVIRRDADRNLWARAKNVGVYVLYHGESNFRRPETPVSPSSISGVPALDADGRILLSSPNGLLIRNKQVWQTIGRLAGLRGTVYAAYEDRQHTLWIGLAGRGLARWAGYHEWTNYTTESGLVNDLVYEILPCPDGSLMVATEAGLMRGRRGSSGAIQWQMVAGVGTLPVHSIRRARGGDIWIGTETRGAARIDARTGAVEWFGTRQGLTGQAPYTLRFDQRQRLWAATESGLFVAAPPYRRFARVEALPKSRFWAMTEGRDGTVWAGGEDGLFEYREDRWKKLTEADGLSSREVLSLGTGADGAIWVGYRFGGGIDRLRVIDAGVKVEKSVQRQGTEGVIYFLETDTRGHVWAGTEHGVDVWDGQHWAHHDSTDGLAWDDCNLNAFATEADGTVWVGTSGGLSRFMPRPALTMASSPGVVFTKLAMGRKDVLSLTNPSVEARSNSLMARYSVLNTARESAVGFRYRLWPAGVEWTETTQRQVEFAELQPGTYRLEVQAREGDGAWNDGGAAFPFEILAPWYRTWWFAGVCCMLPLLIAVTAARLRIAGARRRERELLQLVEEKTLDLRRANEDLLRLSSVDPLTGLANRRIFAQTLERECRRISSQGTAVSLLLIDIDHFKALNDAQGHQRGDDCLAAVGGAINQAARRDLDVAARYGGEEFALILPRTNAPEAILIAERVRRAVAELALPHPTSPVASVITVSVGVATGKVEFPVNPDSLVGAADQALYRAKESGRNRIAVADVACFVQSGMQSTKQNLSQDRRRKADTEYCPEDMSAEEYRVSLASLSGTVASLAAGAAIFASPAGSAQGKDTLRIAGKV